MLKGSQQFGKHRLGPLPAVIAVLEFAQILRKMLATDMDMRPLDRTLEDRPEAFQGVHVNVAASVFLGPVVNRFVPVAKTGKYPIGSPFIGTNTRALRHLGQNVGDQRPAGSTRDNDGIELTATFKNT